MPMDGSLNRLFKTKTEASGAEIIDASIVIIKLPSNQHPMG